MKERFSRSQKVISFDFSFSLFDETFLDLELNKKVSFLLGFMAGVAPTYKT